MNTPPRLTATDEQARLDEMMAKVRVCKTCGATLEWMGEPTGWVDVLSGDEGGTYDICPMNPELDGEHDADPTTERDL